MSSINEQRGVSSLRQLQVRPQHGLYALQEDVDSRLDEQLYLGCRDVDAIHPLADCHMGETAAVSNKQLELEIRDREIFVGRQSQFVSQLLAERKERAVTEQIHEASIDRGPLQTRKKEYADPFAPPKKGARIVRVEANQPIAQGNRAILDHHFPVWVPAAQEHFLVNPLDQRFLVREVLEEQ